MRDVTQMMALYESEESESLNETLVAQGVARVASNADKLATSQVCYQHTPVAFSVFSSSNPTHLTHLPFLSSALNTHP